MIARVADMVVDIGEVEVAVDVDALWVDPDFGALAVEVGDVGGELEEQANGMHVGVESVDADVAERGETVEEYGDYAENSPRCRSRSRRRISSRSESEAKKRGLSRSCPTMQRPSAKLRGKYVPR